MSKLSRSKRIQRSVMALSALAILGSAFNPGFADPQYRRVYNASAQRYEYVPVRTTGDKVRGTVRSGWQNPIIKQSVIGAGVGGVAGAISGRSTLLKGAGVGALTGAGTGLIDSSRVLSDKPMVRSTLKGAAIGTGASVVTEGSVVKGAAVGAGAGAGAHLLRDWWNRR